MAHKAVVWIEPGKATLFAVEADKMERKIVAPANLDAKARDSGNVRNGHLRDNRQYFEAVLAAVEVSIGDDGRWMIAGEPGPARDFGKYVEDHAEALGSRLVGVETLDRLDEGRLLDVARHRLGT